MSVSYITPISFSFTATPVTVDSGIQLTQISQPTGYTGINQKNQFIIDVAAGVSIAKGQWVLYTTGPDNELWQNVGFRDVDYVITVAGTPYSIGIIGLSITAPEGDGTNLYTVADASFSNVAGLPQSSEANNSGKITTIFGKDGSVFLNFAITLPENNTAWKIYFTIDMTTASQTASTSSVVTVAGPVNTIVTGFNQLQSPLWTSMYDPGNSPMTPTNASMHAYNGNIFTVFPPNGTLATSSFVTECLRRVKHKSEPYIGRSSTFVDGNDYMTALFLSDVCDGFVDTFKPEPADNLEDAISISSNPAISGCVSSFSSISNQLKAGLGLNPETDPPMYTCSFSDLEPEVVTANTDLSTAVPKQYKPKHNPNFFDYRRQPMQLSDTVEVEVGPKKEIRVKSPMNKYRYNGSGVGGVAHRLASQLATKAGLLQDWTPIYNWVLTRKPSLALFRHLVGYLTTYFPTINYDVKRIPTMIAPDLASEMHHMGNFTCLLLCYIWYSDPTLHDLFRLKEVDLLGYTDQGISNFMPNVQQSDVMFGRFDTYHRDLLDNVLKAMKNIISHLPTPTGYNKDWLRMVNTNRSPQTEVDSLKASTPSSSNI